MRVGSSNWLVGRGREGSCPANVEDDPGLHPSGQCYLGLAVPLDIDRLLLDASCQRGPEGMAEFMVGEWQGKAGKFGGWSTLVLLELSLLV